MELGVADITSDGALLDHVTVVALLDSADGAAADGVAADRITMILCLA